MAVLTGGYWPSTYWLSNYWDDDYWLAYSAVYPFLMTLTKSVEFGIIAGKEVEYDISLSKSGGGSI